MAEWVNPSAIPQDLVDAICNTVGDCVSDVTDYEEETSSAILTAMLNAGYGVSRR